MFKKTKETYRKAFYALCLIPCLIPTFGYAQATDDADSAAKELANPNTALASLKFKNQYTEFNDNTASRVTIFQPSLPFPLDGEDRIIWRPALPIVWDNERNDDAGLEASGIGDLSFDLAYAVKTDNPAELIAYGTIVSLPTGTDDFGGETTAIGPEFLYGQLSKTYIWGLFPNHQWDVGGDIKVNKTSSQFFSVWLPGGGWNYGTSPTITYDWEAEQWTIPVNLSVGRTIMWNKRPWKLNLEVNYYLDSDDDFGPDWMIGFDITPVVENSLVNWFK